MRDLLKKTAYVGIGLAATASDSVKEAYTKMIEKADEHAKTGEGVVESVLDFDEFTLLDGFELEEADLTAEIQYNS